MNIKNNVGDILVRYKLRMYGETEIIEGEKIISHDDLFIKPTEFALKQNTPNPFNPSTTIEYLLPRDTHIILSVYNISGQLVTVLKDELANAGNYSVTWDASGMPSGIYFYTLKAKEFSETQKMLLLK